MGVLEIPLHLKDVDPPTADTVKGRRNSRVRNKFSAYRLSDLYLHFSLKLQKSQFVSQITVIFIFLFLAVHISKTRTV